MSEEKKHNIHISEEEFTYGDEFFSTILSSLVDYIPDMIFVKEAEELRFVLLNNGAEKFLGYKREEMIGKNDYDFFPEDQADFFTQKDREVLESGELLDIPEETILTKLEGERILHTKKIPIFDEDGNPKYLLGISEDVTEQRKTRKALQESEKRLWGILTTLIDTVILLFDPTEEVVFSWCDILLEQRYGIRESGGKSLIQKFIDYIKKEKLIQIQNIFASGDFYIDEFNLKFPNGIYYFSLIFSPIYGKKGEVSSVVVFINDITERKETKIKLIEQVHLLQNLIDSIPNPIFYKDEKGIYRGCNQAFEDFIGKKREDFLGKTVFDIAPKELAYKYYEKDNELLQNPGIQRYEWMTEDSDGNRREVIFHKATFTKSDGSIGGIVGTIEDITEMKELQQKLANYKETLEEYIDEQVLENKEFIVKLQKEVEQRKAIEKRLKNGLKIFTEGPVVAWSWDPDENWGVNYVSPNVTQFGYQAEEFLERQLTYSEIIHPDDLERIRSKVRESILNDEKCFDLFYKIICKDGNIRKVYEHTVIIKDKTGEISRLNGYIFDITDLPLNHD
jgi:PAS domain S-box-containing protein